MYVHYTVYGRWCALIREFRESEFVQFYSALCLALAGVLGYPSGRVGGGDCVEVRTVFSVGKEIVTQSIQFCVCVCVCVCACVG